MLKIIYDGKIYDVCDETEHCYVIYDISGKGQMLYLPKEECEVV